MKEIPENFFLDASDEMVDYLEAQGVETFNRLEQSYKDSRLNSEKLISILVVGIGAAFMLLYNQIKDDGYVMFISVGLAVFMVCWVLCAFYLLNTCIRTRRRTIPPTSPGGLYYPDKTPIGQLRRWRLWNLEDSCDRMERIALSTAKHLDKVRRYIVLSPCVALCASIMYEILLKRLASLI